jgi:hypothetical protein
VGSGTSQGVRRERERESDHSNKSDRYSRSAEKRVGPEKNLSRALLEFESDHHGSRARNKEHVRVRPVDEKESDYFAASPSSFRNIPERIF